MGAAGFGGDVVVKSIVGGREGRDQAHEATVGMRAAGTTLMTEGRTGD